MMDTRTLQQFLAIAEQLHFGKAARKLGVGQPTLSKSIQRLEHSLGTRLLDRSRREVTLTPAGKIVAGHARRIIAEAEDLQREVRLLLGVEIGTLSIGIGPAMGESYVSGAIARIAERHPGTRISVRSDHWKQLSTWLFAGELDILAADVTELSDDERVEIVALPSEPLVWFSRRGHPLAAARRVTRRDLLAYPLATPKMPQWGLDWFAEADPTREAMRRGTYATVECESYSVLKRMVLSSNCISAALRSTIAAELEGGELVALPIKSPRIKTNAGIVRLRGRTLSPIADAFVEEVLKSANSPQEARTSPRHAGRGRGAS